MIRLEFCKKPEIKKIKIVSKYYEFNIAGRQKKKIDKLDEWCGKYLENVVQLDKSEKSYDYEKVVKAQPKELMAIKCHLDHMSNLKGIMQELEEPSSKGRGTICYVRDTLYTKMKPEARRWLIDSLNVSVCPYCNRNYVFSKDNADTCDLDHFIPESRYPIFAASFYNLIPSCPVCNRKKREKDFCFYPHDLEVDIDNELVFSYIPTDIDFMANENSIEVNVESVPTDRHKVQIETLELDKIYRNHNNIALDIIKKKLIFNEVYIKNLYHEFYDIFASEDEVAELLFGLPAKVDKYGERPLSKMIADILKEISVTVE